ncbi:MAG: hypothetical protein VCA36_10600, partial [Opitutales bacterium]
MILHGITYMAVQSVPAYVMPGTADTYWQSLDDLANSLSDPGSLPDETPDSGEVDDLPDPGGPGPEVTLLSNLDLP